MKYVVDASVAFRWEVTEPDSDKADRLRQEFRTGVHELLAHDLFPAEVGHALTRAERQGRISVGDARPLWRDIMADFPFFHPSFPLMDRALEISSRMRVGVYDCLYVALGEREGCELVTADDKLIRNLQPHFSFIRALASFPSAPPTVTGS